MRVGLSWDLERWDAPGEAWAAVIEEIEQADQMGFDSVWIAEGREGASDCSSPELFMTFAAKRTKSVQLRVAGRRVTRHDPVRIAEQVAVLDTFSRGRAGIAFASGGFQGVAPSHVHEAVDFVTSAWSYDELRYRGDHIRFPAHTPDDAPRGASAPEVRGEYLPQWEWGPITPDYLAITPKPYVSRPPVYVDIEDDDTLEWAARAGIAPFVGADVPTEQAVERLTRYRQSADDVGRRRSEVEAVLERRITLDGPGDATTLGGTTHDLVVAIGDIRAKTGLEQIVWRRSESTPMDLYRFASQVQPLLQA
jgi:alkanesulfonate monooxygenase SsuD/methylene tetrahydromethanopterin reductase-like flavin-dependent oxidoreductase (luciferase family)